MCEKTVLFAESLQEKIELIQTGRWWKLLAELKCLTAHARKVITLSFTWPCGQSEIGCGSNVFIDLAHLSRDHLIPSLCWVYWLSQRFQYIALVLPWLEDALRCTQCVHTKKGLHELLSVFGISFLFNVPESLVCCGTLQRCHQALLQCVATAAGPPACEKAHGLRLRENIRRLVQIDR